MSNEMFFFERSKLVLFILKCNKDESETPIPRVEITLVYSILNSKPLLNMAIDRIGIQGC